MSDEFTNRAADRIAIASPRGQVTAIRLSDGDYALRHGHEYAVVEYARSTAKGRRYGNGRYRNWIIPRARIPEVRHLLQTGDPP